jgi:hypothetical protein
MWKSELHRLSGQDGPQPIYIPLIFGAFVMGGSAANIAALSKEGSNYPQSLQIFNIILVTLGVLLIIYSLIPTVNYFLHKNKMTKKE